MGENVFAYINIDDYRLDLSNIELDDEIISIPESIMTNRIFPNTLHSKLKDCFKSVYAVHVFQPFPIPQDYKSEPSPTFQYAINVNFEYKDLNDELFTIYKIDRKSALVLLLDEVKKIIEEFKNNI
ncbi:MAG: hypothetical protein ACI4V7_06440 [Succinivibrionaceae bacterium]